MINDYTLFFNPEDGKMHKGHAREEKEKLVDVEIGEAVEMKGFRAEGNVLYFTGFEFTTSADIALVVPGGTRIHLVDGVSKLMVVPDGPNANTATLYTKGDLEISGDRGTLINDATHSTPETTLWSRCICCRYGNLTISGGTVIAHSGPCSRNAGAFYAGGRLFAAEYGEEENGAITITGGKVIGMAKPQTVRATNTKLTIGPRSMVENAVEFAGSEEEFHGDCLSMKDETKDVIVSFKKDYEPLPEEKINEKTGAFEGFHMINMEHVDDDSNFMENIVKQKTIDGFEIIPETATYIGININSRTKPEEIIDGFKKVSVFSDTYTFRERNPQDHTVFLEPGPRRKTPGNWLWYMDEATGKPKVLMSLQCMNAVGALDRFREPTGGTGCCMHDGVNTPAVSESNNGKILFETEIERYYIPANVDGETITYADFAKYTCKDNEEFKKNGGWIIFAAHDSEEGIIAQVGPCRFYTSGMYHYGDGETEYYHLMMAAVKVKAQ